MSEKEEELVDKSSRLDIPLEEQRRAWNRWNTEIREAKVSDNALRQGTVIEETIARLKRDDLAIAEIGCGTGWLCGRLVRYGSVTGIDLSDEVLERARQREPSVEFIAGDFMALELPQAHFDVAITIDTLSHFVDQRGCVSRIASMLRPGGLLILGTQNGPVLQRWSQVPAAQPGQIRRWVDHRVLRSLLAEQFTNIRITSLDPQGDQGLLRVVNSVKLNAIASLLLGRARIQAAKERLFFGRTLMATATRR